MIAQNACMAEMRLLAERCRQSLAHAGSPVPFTALNAQINSLPGPHCVGEERYWEGVRLTQCRRNYIASAAKGLVGSVEEWMNRVARYPEALKCPIGHDLLVNPVVAASGMIFSKKNIRQWFDTCVETGTDPICPLTRKSLLAEGQSLWDVVEGIDVQTTLVLFPCESHRVQLIEFRASQLSAYESEIVLAVEIVVEALRDIARGRDVLQELLELAVLRRLFSTWKRKSSERKRHAGLARMAEFVKKLR
jgi:hypothetical protein